MKKTILILMFGFLAFSANSKPYTAYISVQYNPYIQSAIINLGEEMVPICYQDGSTVKFNTIIAVFNYLSKKGWQLVPINIEGTSDNSVKYVFSKTKDTSDNIKSEFVINKKN